MSKLFLNNEAINLNSLPDFKQGMNKLLVIEKKDGHVFFKHDSIYNLPILLTLYSSFGYEEQEISRFIEQNLTTCTTHVDTEEKAFEYCGSSYNGFLGINFPLLPISPIKKVVDNESYLQWENSFLTTFQLFINELGNCVYNKHFADNFKSLPQDVQTAILDKAKFCKARGLETVLAPGTQSIKDVTQPNFDFTLMEFRISSPVALRIYFREINNRVYLASIEQKSNANQDQDIKNAYKILKSFL